MRGREFIPLMFGASGVLCRPRPTRKRARRPAGAGADQSKPPSISIGKALDLTVPAGLSVAPDGVIE